MESQIIRPGHLTAHQTARVQPWYAVPDVAALAAERATAKAA
jgi:hypothetical protein